MTRYSSWDVAAAVPGRKLFIHVISNESFAVLIKVIERVLARSFHGAVSVLDAATGRLLHTTAVGVGAMAVAVDVQTGRVFLASAGPTFSTDSHNPRARGSVDVLDATSGAVVATANTGPGSQALAVDERDARVLVSTGVVLDARMGAVVARARPRTPFGGPYDAVVVDATTGHAVAATTAESEGVLYIVSVLAARSGRTLRSYEVDTTPSGYPAVVAVDDRLHHAFAATGSTLSMLDTRSGRIQHMVRTRPLDAAAVDVSTAQAFAAGLTLPTNRGLVYVIDGRTGCILRTIGVGTGPSALAVDTRSGHLFVANRDDNTISVISVTT